jgi:hypothetical protein
MFVVNVFDPAQAGALFSFLGVRRGDISCVSVTGMCPDVLTLSVAFLFTRTRAMKFGDHTHGFRLQMNTEYSRKTGIV